MAVRVLFCIHDAPYKIGGTYSWAKRLLPTLQYKGLDIHVLAFIEGLDEKVCPTLSFLITCGIPCHITSFLAPIHERVKWILQKADELQPAVLVANHQFEAYYATPWLQRSGIQVVGVLHAADDVYRAVLKNFVSVGWPRRIRAVVAVSKLLESEARVASTKVTVWRIPCGVPSSQHSISPPSTILRIAYAGRLIEYQKRISLVAKAFCRVVREIEGTEALIIGNGPELNTVSAIIASHGATGRVGLVSAVNNLEITRILSTCHVISLLSDYEGLPVALMEGMALGLVPVCFYTPSGIPELVFDNFTGLLVSDRDDSFVNAIRMLRNDNELFARLSINAQNHISKTFCHERCSELWYSCLTNTASYSTQRRPIRIPRKIRLPSPDPALSWGDERPQPWLRTWHQQIRVRFWLGMLRKRICRLIFRQYD